MQPDELVKSFTSLFRTGDRRDRHDREHGFAGRRHRPAGRPGTPRGGRHRHRRRPGRCRRRVLAGHRRGGRAAAGQGRLPARESVWRRPDAARHQGPGRAGHRRQRAGRLAAQQGPAGDRRRHAAGDRLAGAGRLPELRPGPPARRPGPATGEAGDPSRRPAARTHHRHRPDHHTGRPGGRRHRQGGRPGAQLSRPDRAGLRRGIRSVRAEPGPAAQRQATDGGRGAPVLPQPAHQRRLPGVLAGASGTARPVPTTPTCFPATAGSSAWATVR